MPSDNQLSVNIKAGGQVVVKEILTFKITVCFKIGFNAILLGIFEPD